MTVTEVPLTVTLHVKDETVPALLAKAAQCDDESNGSHQSTYTVEQALSVVWHNEPEWLHANVLTGWVAESVTWDPDATWVEADEN